jgi:hypothetical protein
MPMRGPPEKDRGRPGGNGPDTQQITATNGPTIIADQGDPRRIGELLADWVGIRMAEVDTLVGEARAKAAAIPDQRHLWLICGEVLVRLAALELEVAELRKAARR